MIMTGQRTNSTAKEDKELDPALSFRPSQKVMLSPVSESQECQNYFCCHCMLWFQKRLGITPNGLSF